MKLKVRWSNDRYEKRPLAPRWDVDLPNAFMYVGPHFVCLHEDGSWTIYCDGDVTIHPSEGEQMRRLAAQFSYERRNKS